MACVSGPMERFKAEFLSKGGSEDEWRDVLSEGLTPEDMEEYEVGFSKGSPMEHAKKVLSVGRVVEYSCYDHQWRPQGKALIEIQGFDDEAHHTLRARHLKASDDYYEWYAQTQLGEDRAVYHLCDVEAKKCPFKLRSRDRREVVHLAEWKAVSPGMMLTAHYSKEIAYGRVEEAVRRYVPHPGAPPRAGGEVLVPEDPGRGGTGLDEVLQGMGPGRPEAPKEREPPGGVEVPRGSVGAVLKRKADEHQAATALKKRPRKKKKKTDEKLAKKKRKGADESDSESSREASSTSSDGDFRQPPTREGEELWRLSRKYPGKLLKRGMKELGRYLADRAGDGEGGRWEDRRVMAYINQVMLSQGGSQGIGLRNQREAVNPRHLSGPLADGRFGVPGGHSNAKAEGIGVGSSRPGVAKRETLGDNPPAECFPLHSGGAGSSGEARAPNAETPRGHDKGEQIGNRRRGAEILRDAISEQPKSDEVGSGEIRREGQPDSTITPEGREDQRGPILLPGK